MRNRAFRADQYQFKKEDRLLIDANVWIILYGRQVPGDKRISVYSKALKDIRTAGSSIFIDILIMSEFINRLARMEFDIAKQLGKYKTIKSFRKSSEFKPVAESTVNSLTHILKGCARIGSGFERMDVEAFFDDYINNKTDFNDHVLARICKSNGFKLVTDDFDFKDLGIDLITGNQRYFREKA